ncbi:hybrid sensor histidine kinase/response regulator [Xanthocytophaga flava]|uniref:hybrid sensor histidine kinase/response regulator n=1 Tax=Xanthocytophaga flava TaxID=3048013 RepID=UPI0028D170CF|nr:response regulator [Xanthocytophaga flavus]MDJ1467814.1 response regulator [Xanthocytophaga flavus]
MILIVDDKPENILSLKSILVLNSFEVDTALSGEEALVKILKNTYSLIILDVQMPGMDGFEVAEAISGLSRTKDTPIIFLSAVSIEKNFVTKGFESGAIDYITKPVDPDIFMLKVRTFCKLYEQTRALNNAHLALQQEVEVRKEAERALQSTLTGLHLTLESLPQIAFTATPDGKIEFVNQRWYQYSDSKDIFPSLHADDESLTDRWDECIHTGKLLEMEFRIRELTTGEYRYHLLRVMPVITNGIIVKWVGTFTDINEQKRLSEFLEQKVNERTRALQETNQQLEASNHDLQQFASVASHDLQEPLRKIRIFSSMIKSKKYTDPDLLEYLSKITDSSERMSTLIQDLLNFARLSKADSFKLTDLNEIIREILSDLELVVTEKQAFVSVSPMPSLDVIPGLIRQALQNIISNALKFSKPDNVPVVTITADFCEELSVDSPSVVEGEYCRIYIRDNGIGFEEKYSDIIFTLFQRLNSSEQYEGTGIGLAIAKKIVEKHNGLIIAQSIPEQGSVFTIILPVLQQKESFSDSHSLKTTFLTKKI